MKIKRFFLICVALLACLLIANRFKIINLNALSLQSVNTVYKKIKVSSNPKYKDFQITPPFSKLSYDEVLRSSEYKRQQLAKAYNNANTKPAKQVLLNKARMQFIETATTLLPYWYGTPWDYNGTSEIPQQGSIACGYYVTTVLEDSGMKVERRKLAQQASENIIKSLTEEAFIKRYSKVSLDKFINSVDAWGEGLYIVGLDTHVGYIWHDGKDIHFIHSTVSGPRSAFSEPAKSSTTLANSNYRVLAKISDDDKLLVKWLIQSDIFTET